MAAQRWPLATLLTVWACSVAVATAATEPSSDPIVTAVGLSAKTVMGKGETPRYNTISMLGGVRVYIAGQGFASGDGNVVYFEEPNSDDGDYCPPWYGVCDGHTIACPLVDLVHDASMTEETDGMLDLTATSRRSASTTFLACEAPPAPLPMRSPGQGITDWMSQYTWLNRYYYKVFNVKVFVNGEEATCRTKNGQCTVKCVSPCGRWRHVTRSPRTFTLCCQPLTLVCCP